MAFFKTSSPMSVHVRPQYKLMFIVGKQSATDSAIKFSKNAKILRLSALAYRTYYNHTPHKIPSIPDIHNATTVVIKWNFEDITKKMRNGTWIMRSAWL